MKTIGYAVVGTGYFGSGAGPHHEGAGGARVVAVYDPENAGTVAAELGCDTETDLDRLYSREDVDAVIVASPTTFTRNRSSRRRSTGYTFSVRNPLPCPIRTAWRWWRHALPTTSPSWQAM